MNFLKNHPNSDEKNQTKVGSLRIFVPMITLKNKGVKQGIQYDRNHHREERMRPVRISCAVKPTCGNNIPDDESEIRKTENREAFFLEVGKFRNVMLQNQERNERDKYKKRNAVGRPGNAQQNG